MDWPEVAARIAGGENETTELKRWEAFPKRVADAACALANTDGGLIVLGVADDGVSVGVPLSAEEVEERLTGFLQSGLSAPLRGRLGRHEEGGKRVHWIEVLRTRGPEPLKAAGRFLVRRGRASVEASGAELQDLFNTFGLVVTEEQTIPDTTPDDVDPSVFRRFLERQGIGLDGGPQPPPVRDFVNRGVVRDVLGESRLTLYGLLCFGRDPQRFPPTRSAWIETVAYAGADRASEVVHVGEARGRLDEQVDRALAWAKLFGKRESYGEVRREDQPLLPARALREGLVNAVAHRDYAILGGKTLFEVFPDRVVISSAGEMPNGMRPEMALAGGHPRTRNELIANFLLVEGLMEKRGRGLLLIREEMAAFNGTVPLLETHREGRYTRLTLQTRCEPIGLPVR